MMAKRVYNESFVDLVVPGRVLHLKRDPGRLPHSPLVPYESDPQLFTVAEVNKDMGLDHLPHLYQRALSRVLTQWIKTHPGMASNSGIDATAPVIDIPYPE